MYAKAHKFMCATQAAGESDIDFLLRVEYLSRQQEIGTSPKENEIRERFALCVAVRGLRDSKLKIRLMSKTEMTWPELCDTLKSRQRASEATVILGTASYEAELKPSWERHKVPIFEQCYLV